MKLIKQLSFWLAIGLLATSCMDEREDLPNNPIDDRDEALVELHLETPALSQPGSRSVDEAYENGITNMAVIILQRGSNGVFEPIGVEFLNLSSPIATTGSVRVALPLSQVPVKLLLVANYSLAAMPLLGNVTSILGYSNEDDLRSAFQAASASAMVTSSIMPMYGEITLPSITPTTTTNQIIPLMRSVARVDMVLELEAQSKPFTPAEIRVYNARQYMQTIPDRSAIDVAESSRVSRPSIIESSALQAATTLASDPEVDPSTGLFFTAYLPENVAATSADEQLDATCFVIGGYYNNSPDKTWYRVDFNSKIAGHPFGQILRNYRYIFEIVSVTASGFPTPDEAAEKPAVSMEVEVTPWGDQTSDITFVGPGDYFTLADRTPVLAYEAGSVLDVEITTTLPFDMDLEGEPIKSSDVESSGPIAHSFEFFDFSIAFKGIDLSGPLPVSTYQITLTAKADNYSGTNADDFLIVVGGRSLSVQISQDPKPTYEEPRRLRVHSLTTGLGYIGGGDADGLNAILTNAANFGPGAKVDIDELTITRGSALDVDAGSEADLKSLLSNVDALIVPGYLAPTIAPACLNVIMQWTKNPTHTLIVYVDEPTTNRPIRDSIAATFGYSLNWSQDGSNLETILESIIGIVFSPTFNLYGTVPDVARPEDAPFLSAAAPFGAPDRSTSFTTSDGICTFVDYDAVPLPDYVIPVLNVSGRYLITNREVPAIQMGVDVKNGIVWMGDSQTNNNDYTNASADLTKVLGNVWAWIAERANP